MHIKSYLTKQVKRYNSSMLLESSCSEMESLKDEISLPRENFHFLRSGLSSQGLTVRPRLDSQAKARQRPKKRKCLTKNEKELEAAF